jgi:ethanolamine utilization microcompartment shell protein EutS
MKEIISYLVANVDSILLVASTVVAAASAIAALTPTPSDDALVAKAYKVIDWLALNVGKAKDK